MNLKVFHLYRDMILREFPCNQSVKEEFPFTPYATVCMLHEIFAHHSFFCRVLRICMLTLPRTVSCAGGERDGYHGRYAHTYQYKRINVHWRDVILFCVCLELYQVVIF